MHTNLSHASVGSTTTRIMCRTARFVLINKFVISLSSWMPFRGERRCKGKGFFRICKRFEEKSDRKVNIRKAEAADTRDLSPFRIPSPQASEGCRARRARRGGAIAEGGTYIIRYRGRRIRQAAVAAGDRAGWLWTRMKGHGGQKIRPFVDKNLQERRESYKFTLDLCKSSLDLCKFNLDLCKSSLDL